MTIDNINEIHDNIIKYRIVETRESNKKRDVIKTVTFIALAIILGAVLGGVMLSYDPAISLTKGIVYSGVAMTGAAILGGMLGSAYYYITKQKKPKEELEEIETKNEVPDDEFRDNSGGSAQEPAAGKYSNSTNVRKKGERRE